MALILALGCCFWLPDSAVSNPFLAISNSPKLFPKLKFNNFNFKNIISNLKSKQFWQFSFQKLFQKINLKFNLELVLVSLFALTFFVLTNFRGEEVWQITMKNYGLSPFWISLVFGIAKIISLFTSVLLARFGHLFRTNSVLIFGNFLILIAYLIFLIPTLWSPFLALSLYYFGENLVRPTLKSQILVLVPTGFKATSCQFSMV